MINPKHSFIHGMSEKLSVIKLQNAYGYTLHWWICIL